MFFFLKIDFVLANSADNDEMPHYAACHLGLYCLPKYPFKGDFQYPKSKFLHMIWAVLGAQTNRRLYYFLIQLRKHGHRGNFTLCTVLGCTLFDLLIEQWFSSSAHAYM